MTRLDTIKTALLTLCACVLIAPCVTFAAQSQPVSTPRVTATLLSDRNTVTPGERFQVALVQNIAKGWHTYWANPGDSGEPTRIEWSLPTGVTAGDIQWPAPKAIPVDPLVNFGFDGTIFLIVDVTAPRDAKPSDTLALKATATWLVCEKICIPEEGAFTLELSVGETPVVDARAEQRLATARAALPKAASFRGRLAPSGNDLALALPGIGPAVTDLRFFPLSDTLIDHAAPQTKKAGSTGTILQLTRSPAFKVTDGELSGVLTYRDAGVPRALNASIDVDPALMNSFSAAAPAQTAAILPESNLTFWTALVFAFAGGLILNLMPCVLPVLFIKALGFAQAAQSSPRQVRGQGLLFLTGVLATFVVLASVIIGLGELGSSVGWGYQLQSPPVVIALAVVMALIGFNLLGAFEIGSSLQGVGQQFADTKGRTGAFATGALAVIVATPCTAPFMGAAIGYAFAQPPVVAISVFLALALGFAFPVVALSFAPGWLRLLPKPGRWMLILKQAFAFPMFATAIWLNWVASVQSGADGVLAALSAVLAAGFIVWLLETTRNGATASRAIGYGGSLLAAIVAGVFVLQTTGPSTTQSVQGGERETAAQTWTPERVAALQAEGRPVFVNFTAAWCITCLANERVALSRSDVKSAFTALGVTYLKADWTRRDAVIAQKLAEYGRAGVPLYLFYPATKGAQAEVLPQLLTANIVVKAAERAAGREIKSAAIRP
ncbi:MAG TPA: protein-disulfide reductase DsbD domain-containing protein [Xanthobacteraceae bacterium]|nr:protein-disulfide reductase DsbD domain-containing protein [Xanthobacteraceae bacterium]